MKSEVSKLKPSEYRKTVKNEVRKGWTSNLKKL
jgi:hypothetical protein